MTERDDHAGATAGAVQQLEELLSSLQISRGQFEMAVGSVVASVGDPPAVESGRMALEFTMASKEALDEVYRGVSAALMELRRYQGGF